MTKPPQRGGPAPNNVIAALQRAVTAHRAGNLSEAETLYKFVLASDRRNFDALHMLGIVYSQRGNRAEAKEVLTRALRVNPRSPEALVNLGRVQFESGDPTGAEESYRQALAMRANFPLALSNHSIVLRNTGRPDEALAQCDRALALEPNYADAWNNRANALFDLRHYQDASSSYEKALLLEPNMREALVGHGNALVAMKRYPEALAAYDRALTLDPALADAWAGRGSALVAMKRYPEALATFGRLNPLRPEAALLSAAEVLTTLGRYDDALTALDRVLTANPDQPQAWQARCELFTKTGRFNDACTACSKAYALAPGLSYAGGHLLHAKLHLSDWTDLPALTDGLIDRIQNGELVALPFTILAVTGDCGPPLACARTVMSREFPQRNPPPVNPRPGARVRIAYLSADFRDHAVSRLLSGVLERHDRARFEITAVSFRSDPTNPMQQRVRDACEHFVDAADMNDQEVVKLLRARDVDIAVDLMGFTKDWRPGILAERVAPVQVNYLGYPGTMGADFIDYIIADDYAVPQRFRSGYTEKVVRLPDTFQANDRARPWPESAASRADFGLPDDAFVFCSFNANAKITPELFDVWMRLLARVDGVLWIFAESDAAADNLRTEARGRGIDPARLIFAKPVGYMDYLARYRRADLFLDTYPFNGGTTVSDALWMGLPVLTCSGEAFAARMGGSLLKAAGIPELITSSLADYEERAVALAIDRQRLAAISEKLRRERLTCALFDTDRFRRHFEAAYLQMHQRHLRGEPPADFDVAADGA